MTTEITAEQAKYVKRVRVAIDERLAEWNDPFIPTSYELTDAGKQHLVDEVSTFLQWSENTPAEIVSAERPTRVVNLLNSMSSMVAAQPINQEEFLAGLNPLRYYQGYTEIGAHLLASILNQTIIDAGELADELLIIGGLLYQDDRLELRLIPVRFNLFYKLEDLVAQSSGI